MWSSWGTHLELVGSSRLPIQGCMGHRVVDQSPCAFWGHGQPPGALGMAERETAVKAGWGPDGSEVGENACVCVGWGEG